MMVVVVVVMVMVMMMIYMFQLQGSCVCLDHTRKHFLHGLTWVRQNREIFIVIVITTSPAPSANEIMILLAGRWWEARTVWGTVIHAVRNLARRVSHFTFP